VATDWRHFALNSWQIATVNDTIRRYISVVMMAVMMGTVIWLWSEGRAGTGDVVYVFTSFMVMTAYLRHIGEQISNLQKAVSEMEDIVFFWKTDIAVQDVPNAGTLVASKGDIEFDRVNFAYKGQRKPIYDNFALRIKPGEKVALVGHSGSGKSTFVKLLQRLYDIQGGEIRIDGQNIASVTQESLRKAIALVPQEPILFHRTLWENIAYGRPGASMDEIVAAAEKAYAHEFIQTLPLGYDTLVGERGVKLSGGERQRVAIARAILANAPILILDEATSSLDSISEHVIQKALAALIEGRTTITIAHRLATIKAVDRILVFNEGSIVEEGTHASLTGNPRSHYKRLYDMQALDLVGEDYAA
jgi:ATP-binding cassette subfamily B protein